MKKILIGTALFLLAGQTGSAQQTTVRDSRLTDNWYLGISGGVSVPTTGYSWTNNLNPVGGLRIGRYLTPSFGLAIEGNALFDNQPNHKRGTVVQYLNASLLATVNLSNFLFGYRERPRVFELVALPGVGWGRTYGTSSDADRGINTATSKMALDLTFNLGRARAWQLYLEPAIVYTLNGQGHSGLQYNINQSTTQLTLGLNYKLRNSHGTHNFSRVGIRDQYEIDVLNQQLNELRGELREKDKSLARSSRTVSELRDSLEAARQVKPATIINRVTQVVNNNVLQPTVIFQQGSSQVDAAQMASVAMIAKYMKNHPEARLLIKGYASPEGSVEVNQRISENRANAVKTVLVNRYQVNPARLETQGMGATDELFDEVDFNRVATFTDLSK